MGMLFKLSGDSLFMENPELKALEDFRGLTEKELRYVILVSDWAGPLRRLPLQEKKKKALRSSGYFSDGKITYEGKDVLSKKNKKIEAALREYKKLQGWSEAEILEGIDETLGHFNELMKSRGTEVDDKIKIAKSLPDLLKKRKEILDLIESSGIEDEEDPISQEEEQMSRIDKVNTSDA